MYIDCCHFSRKMKYLQLSPLLLHLLLCGWNFADIPQTSLVILQRVLCVFGVSDHNIDGLQPEIKQIFTYNKNNNSWKLKRRRSESHKGSLVQVDRGEAVDVVHLLQSDVELGAKHRGRA